MPDAAWVLGGFLPHRWDGAKNKQGNRCSMRVVVVDNAQSRCMTGKPRKGTYPVFLILL